MRMAQTLCYHCLAILPLQLCLNARFEQAISHFKESFLVKCIMALTGDISQKSWKEKDFVNSLHKLEIYLRLLGGNICLNWMSLLDMEIKCLLTEDWGETLYSALSRAGGKDFSNMAVG